MAKSYPYQYLNTRIKSEEYVERRETLMAHMADNSIAILPSATLQIRSNDTEYKFRQDSDFNYLTGFLEPDSVLVLVPGREKGEVIYFCREKDPDKELWDGYREGPEGLCASYGADDAFPINDIDDILPGLLESRERVYYAMGRRPEFDQRIMNWLNALRATARNGSHPPGEFSDLNHLLHDMRLFKSRPELKLMQAAADISCMAHNHAMATCEPGMYEGQLEAEYLHQFGVRGAPAAAYNTIVGAGANACVLHYVENNQKISDGDLVLVDAGCEFQSYASDISRTFPANGKFTKAQQAIYEIVLEAQYAAIDATVAGNHWDDPHNQSVRVIGQGLLDLGLLEGDLNEIIETEKYKEFYMHRVGHWLGMDVHDVGDYKICDEWRVLEPGMVMTVEPGIYISPSNKGVKAKWRGIGIRIEDNVVVKRKGNDVITSAAVKTVADVEKQMAKARTSKSSKNKLGVSKAKKSVQKKARSKKASPKTKASKKTLAKKIKAKKRAAIKKRKKS